MANMTKQKVATRKVKSVSVAKPLKAIIEKQTKSQIIEALTVATLLPKKQINQILQTLSGMIHSHMRKGGSGEFTIPNTGVRIIRKTRPATKKRKGRNPATGEAITIKAKPASTVIRIRALKALKDSITA